jgi:hypothetical protein
LNFREAFLIFHDGILTQKFCQIDLNFREENNENKSNPQVFWVVSDRWQFRTILRITNQSLCSATGLPDFKDLFGSSLTLDSWINNSSMTVI